MNGSDACRWDDDLAGTPLRIAGLDHTPIRVMAGPGTGKTFALMRRVARLLQQGVTPRRILVCTFTRTAARDLSEELSCLGIDGVENVRAGTLHSICFSLLSQEEVLQHTRRVPRPLLAYEERFLLEDLVGDNFGGIRERSKRLKAFNAAWARLQSDEPGWPTNRVDRAFHLSLLSWLRFHNCILIGELVPETLRYLRDNPNSPHLEAYDHVLVDEYQDLNRAEQELLDHLSNSGNLAIIGDEDQSIYSFKYAHPEGVSGFHQTHLDTHDEDLIDCRRCPTRIVDMANSLISNNQNRTDRILNYFDGNPEGEIYVVQWNNLDEEASGIAQFISERVQNLQIDPGQVLVLSPRRHFGYAIRDALINVGVSAHSFFHEEALQGNPKHLEGSIIQQAFCLLTLLADQDDIVALRCWCGFGNNNLGHTGWRRLREYCEETGDSPWDTLANISEGQVTIPYTAYIVGRFNALIQQLNELQDLRGQELLEAIFPMGEETGAMINQIASQIDTDDYDAATLREVLRVGITQPELPTDVDYVRVMSLHKSKGLTADLVIVDGCLEGLLPFIVGDTRAEEERMLEEQRRLFYVAITRARQILFLSSVSEIPRDLAHRIGAQVRGGSPSHARTISSRFLAELGRSRPSAIRGRELFP
jgi:superfamily I DNA/RNA helicase